MHKRSKNFLKRRQLYCIIFILVICIYFLNQIVTVIKHLQNITEVKSLANKGKNIQCFFKGSSSLCRLSNLERATLKISPLIYLMDFDHDSSPN